MNEQEKFESLKSSISVVTGILIEQMEFPCSVRVTMRSNSASIDISAVEEIIFSELEEFDYPDDGDEVPF